jgi:DNA-directed RNA polymerase I subunit RPA2
MIQFSKNKEMFFVPLIFILKALVETTDHHIYKELMRNNEDNTFLKGCVCSQLRAAMEDGLVNQKAALQFMGQRFRVKAELPEWTPDDIITKQLLRKKCWKCFVPSNQNWNELQRHHLTNSTLH